MLERTQEPRTAEQELDWYLQGLPAAPNLKQWMLGWLQRHQPPTLSREQVYTLLKKHEHFIHDADRQGYHCCKCDDLLDDLCALALPQRPTVTVTKEQIEAIFTKHDRHYRNRESWRYAIIDDLTILCTGAGEAPTGWCAHTKNLQSIEMITQDPGYPQIGSHVPAHEVLFCPVCTAPRPRPEAR